MTYFNDPNHASFYYSGSEGLYPYPSPTQTFAIDTEGANGQIYGGPADQWSMVRRSGPMVGSPTSLWATASFESVAPTTSYTSRIDGYSWPSYDWSEDYRQAQYNQSYQQAESHHSGYFSQDGSFASTVASETSSAAQPPCIGEYWLEESGIHRLQTVPLNYGGASQSGPSTGTFDVGNVNPSHWPRTGPTRAEVTQTEWYQPYGVSRTRQNWYRNAEAGPSTLVARPVSFTDLPPTQPSGGISETMADAKTTQTFTEEDMASHQKPKKARVPRGKGRVRPGRVCSGRVGRSLCEWVQQKSRRLEAPTFNQALAVAVWIIRKKRRPAHKKPCLRTWHGGRSEIDSKNAKKELERRNVERRLYRRLSRYYKVPGGGVWTRPPLLEKVLGNLEDLWNCGELKDLGGFGGFWNHGGIEGLWDHEDIQDLKEYLEELEGVPTTPVPAVPAISEPPIEPPS